MTLNEAIYSKEKIIEYNGNIFYLGGLDAHEEGDDDFMERALEFYAKKKNQKDKKSSPVKQFA